MDNKKDNLNFNYKKISEDEILLDNVLNTNEKDINKKEIITEMIKGNISDLVKNQLNSNQRDDLQENAYTDSENYTNVNKKTNWFAEYKKQTITVTKEMTYRKVFIQVMKRILVLGLLNIKNKE